ncbi:MAG: T9SS type A sorting domain-containing protein [Bacteroidetes bacterium]|jgi:regulation of enolase protein 1 (concanavalin A-like superfamily)|nr:T9SS type A sorting domain-containing protein [Bacteroidota bacterium]
MSKNYALLLITMFGAGVLCANHSTEGTRPTHPFHGPSKNSTEPSAVWKTSHLLLPQPFTDGAPNPAAQAAFSPGDIIVSEIMQNPRKIEDHEGEWFELHNTTSAPIDLLGWTIKDLSNGNDHTIASNVVVQPGGYALLMRQGNPAINGGLTADYVYGFTVSFRNDGDEVVIEDPSGHEIDRVAYDDGAVWPDPDGASMSLDPSFYNATANDNGIYWCEATSFYAPDNRGTPGAANTFCFPPVEALCKDINVELSSDGMADITADQIDNGSSSPFGIQALSLDISTFSCMDIGENTVTLTVTDQVGNDDSCQGVVTVEDNIAPSAACLSTTVLIQPNGTYTLQEADVLDAANSFDNCAIADVNFPATTYTCDDAFQSLPVNVTISDATGNTDNCTATVTVQDGVGLVAPWTATDVGSAPAGNAYSFEACGAIPGQFTVTGSGNNAVSSTTDNVAFAHQTLCGDGMITAKLESITPNGYGGLMIRETTAAGSKQVSIFSNLTNVLRHESRATTNGPKTAQSHFRPFPFWLRLQRMGDWVFAYYSTTGTTFSYVHAVYVPMQSCVEIGLASFTYLPNQQTEAVFSNVSISGSTALASSGVPDFVQQGGAEQLPTSFSRRSPERSRAKFPLLPADVASSEVVPNSPILFPNPTNRQFTLRFPQALQGEATASLRNQVGQVLQQRQLRPGDMTTEWNVSQLPAGLYFMEVRQKGVPPQVLRVVKQ